MPAELFLPKHCIEVVNLLESRIVTVARVRWAITRQDYQMLG
jgi:hypothetical protein